MELRKLAPWNWFKKEEEQGHGIPVRRTETGQSSATGGATHQMLQLQREIDHLFANFLRGFDLPAMGSFRSLVPSAESAMLKPRVDLSATDGEYRLSVEIPGVNEKDVLVSVSGGVMSVRGEKKQEKEEKEKDYYRIERSYGRFERILSLPDDVDQNGITAGFKNGVLTVTMPRKALPAHEVKQIEISTPS